MALATWVTTWPCVIERRRSGSAEVLFRDTGVDPRVCISTRVASHMPTDLKRHSYGSETELGNERSQCKHTPSQLTRAHVLREALCIPVIPVCRLHKGTGMYARQGRGRVLRCSAMWPRTVRVTFLQHHSIIIARYLARDIHCLPPRISEQCRLSGCAAATFRALRVGQEQS